MINAFSNLLLAGGERFDLPAPPQGLGTSPA